MSGEAGAMRRASIAVLLALAACWTSSAERRRQVIACGYEIGSAQDKGVGCLMLRFGWTEEDATVAAYARAAEIQRRRDSLVAAYNAERAAKEQAAAKATGANRSTTGTHSCLPPGATAWTTCPNELPGTDSIPKASAPRQSHLRGARAPRVGDRVQGLGPAPLPGHHWCWVSDTGASGMRQSICPD